jgi:hypothetical protein
LITVSARSTRASYYGDLPPVDNIWTLKDEEGIQTHTPEEVRSLVLEILQLPASYQEMHKISQAMASAIALNPSGVQRTLRNAAFWVKHQETMIEEKTKAATANAGLPLIEADVLKYSEKPLENGHELHYKLMPLMEEMARIEMRICLDLDVTTFGIEGALCCRGGRMFYGRVGSGANVNITTEISRY